MQEWLMVYKKESSVY